MSFEEWRQSADYPFYTVKTPFKNLHNRQIIPNAFFMETEYKCASCCYLCARNDSRSRQRQWHGFYFVKGKRSLKQDINNAAVISMNPNLDVSAMHPSEITCPVFVIVA
jgi:hypothetical protein